MQSTVRASKCRAWCPPGAASDGTFNALGAYQRAYRRTKPVQTRPAPSPLATLVAQCTMHGIRCTPRRAKDPMIRRCECEVTIQSGSTVAARGSRPPRLSRPVTATQPEKTPAIGCSR